MTLQKTLNLVIIFLLSLHVYAWEPLYYMNASQGLLEVHFLDVGQGDAILIKTPNNKYCLIDGGLGIEILEKIGEVVPIRNFTLDFIMVSHPDADHIEGLLEITKRYKTGAILIEKTGEPSTILTELLSEIENEQIPTFSVDQDTDFILDGVTFNILYPHSIYATFEEQNINNTSIAMEVSYKNFSMFTAGDLETKHEDQLIEEIDESDVLKVGHHGSSTSSSKEFINELNPKVSVISVGEQNTYGHPTASVLKYLQEQNSIIFRTDKEGSITVKTDGKYLYLSNNAKIEV